MQSVYAYTPKVLVEQFDIAMDHFQYKQLIITGFHTAAEVQTRIPSTRQAQSLTTYHLNTATHTDPDGACHVVVCRRLDGCV